MSLEFPKISIFTFTRAGLPAGAVAQHGGGDAQAKLAEQIGMSAAYLGQIERGNRGNSFSLETLYQIADALEIDVNLLIKNEMLA